MFFPRGDRIQLVRARRGEDRVPEPSQRFILRQIWEYSRRPRGSGARYDGPVNLVAHNQFQRRTVCFRGCAIHPAHLFRIFLRKQGRIVAGDREARCAAPISLGHAFEEPRCSGVEAGVRTVAKAKQRRLLVSKQRGDERGARFIGMLRNAPHQRDRVQRGGHHQLLSGRESQSGADGDFCKAVEILFEFR